MGYGYDNNARSRYYKDAQTIVADAATTVTVERKVPNGLKQPEIRKYGPYTVRLDEFRQTRGTPAFDEKGTTATIPFVLLAVDLGRDTFKVEDRLEDVDGNRYRVTSPARIVEGVLTVNVELIG